MNTTTPRFIRPEHVAELSNLWHISRTALAAKADRSNHARMIYTSNEFHRAHPEISSTAAYKALGDMLGR